MSSTERNRKLGRPTGSRLYTFKEEYCDRLIQIGKEGGTIAMFCSEIGIYKDIFYEWVEVHQIFKDAKKTHETHWEAHSDRLGLAALNGELKGFALGVWIWTRKNKLKERDQVSIEQTNSFQPVVIELANGNQVQLGMADKAIKSE